MDDIPHKEIEKASASKRAESSASNSDNDDKGDDSSSSSSSFGGPNLKGFSEEQTKALDMMMRKRVGKAIKRSMHYYVKKTILNIQELMHKEFDELKRIGGN